MQQMSGHDLKWALEWVFEYASEINKYIDDTAPWKITLESDEETRKLENILFILVSNLRKIALMLLPFFDLKMRELLERIGTPYDDHLTLDAQLTQNPGTFFVAGKGDPLYMRISN